jgi:hypothetical protein
MARCCWFFLKKLLYIFVRLAIKDIRKVCFLPEKNVGTQMQIYKDKQQTEEIG